MSTRSIEWKIFHPKIFVLKYQNLFIQKKSKKLCKLLKTNNLIMIKVNVKLN